MCCVEVRRRLTSSNQSNVVSGSYGRFWLSKCDGVGNRIYSTCTSNFEDFTVGPFTNDLATCGSDQSAIFSSWDCEPYYGKKSCSVNTAGGECNSNDVTRLWESTCSAGLPSAAPGAVCVNNTSGNIKKTDFRLVIGNFVGASTATAISCASNEKVIGGSVSCENSSLILSCPSSSGTCISTAAEWGREWAFRCADPGYTFHYVVICVPN